MKNDAKLTIIFCTYKSSVFDKFILNKEEFKTDIGKIEKNFIFNEYEQELGKKYCYYELIPENVNTVFSGSFEISLGNNIGYCFLDDPGITFKILFLQKMDYIDNFIKSKFTCKIHSILCKDKEFELSLNRNGTEDRANLILINCLSSTLIKKDGKLIINLEKVENKIFDFKEHNGYQICFYYDNFQDFSYQEIEEINKLNFDKLFIENNKDVEQMYNILNNLFECEDKNKAKNLVNNLTNIYNEKKLNLKGIINKKYVYGNKILEKELYQEYYFDFIFKVLSLILFEENISKEKNFDNDKLKNMHKRLLENKLELDKDKLLKIYEKIFLLMEVYSSDLLSKDDYIIYYFHINYIEKNSPLYYAYEFLNDFLKELNSDSDFYFPLLSINGGFYEYFYKVPNGTRFISTYGFNMLPLYKIKDNLINIIPNIIILSKYIKEADAVTNPLTGNIILNINLFKNINICKKEFDENISKHYAFFISKILIHEIFGQKNSFSKSEKNNNSIISFRNELGEFKLINCNCEHKNNFNEIFKDVIEIYNGKNPECFKGDSGYFIEYFMGKINNEYTIGVINTIIKFTNLSKLLNPKLWHKKFFIIKEYLKLKSIFLDLFPLNKIDNDFTIYEQIELMKEKIYEEDKQIKEKYSIKNIKINIELTERINQLFNDIWITRKNIKNGKENYISSIKKDGSQRRINGFLKSFFAEFTHGYYRK